MSKELLHLCGIYLEVGLTVTTSLSVRTRPSKFRPALRGPNLTDLHSLTHSLPPTLVNGTEPRYWLHGGCACGSYPARACAVPICSLGDGEQTQSRPDDSTR